MESTEQEFKMAKTINKCVLWDPRRNLLCGVGFLEKLAKKQPHFIWVLAGISKTAKI
jgi:hypothetical protein